MRKLVIGLLVFGFMIGPALAHPGGTDSKGGHTNHSTGEYHYHHGYSAHDHVDGVCPYDYDDRTGENSGSSGASISYSYGAKAEAYDWYDEYCEAQEARRAAEKELQDIKSNQLQNLAMSAAVGLCGGLSTLIVQIRRSHKRLEETRRRLLAQTEQSLAAMQKKYEDQERNNELKRRNNCELFAEMAKEKGPYLQRLEYIQRIVQNTTNPDLSEGAVYIQHDFSSNLFHNECAGCGVGDMVLVSKRTAKSFGMTQCTACAHLKQPDVDIPVAIPWSESARCYHRRGASCVLSPKLATLSEAQRKRFEPCMRCKPPKENPKVWF